MKETRLIGIAGAGRGTGATHLAVQIANYLCSCRQRRTALLEWNDHGDLERIGRMFLKRPGKSSFRLLEVDYYRDGSAQRLAACMSGVYDDIVIDFGEIRDEIRTEWYRCGLCILTAALNDWKLESLLEWISGKEKLKKGWIFCAAFGSETTRREVEKQFQISIKRIPFSEDPFSVGPAEMKWLSEIQNC